MADPTRLIYGDAPGPLPAEYEFTTGETIELQSVAATYSGASAAEPFLPCLSLYSQDGKLIGRWFPPSTVGAGDSAVVTFGVDPVGSQDASALRTYRKISAASTNADTIKASPGEVRGWYIFNAAAAARFVKLYNKASSPTVGTDTPLLTIGLSAGAAANIISEAGVEFDTGIAVAMTAGIADSDATAVALNDIALNVLYV